MKVNSYLQFIAANTMQPATASSMFKLTGYFDILLKLLPSASGSRVFSDPVTILIISNMASTSYSICFTLTTSGKHKTLNEFSMRWLDP